MPLFLDIYFIYRHRYNMEFDEEKIATYCIALGWRVVDWPLPIAATRTVTRISNRTGGSRDQRNHWEGTRAQGSSSKYKGLQPFFLEGQVRRYSEQPFPLHYPPPPPTHLWAVWAGTNYPPPQRHPFPQETVI
jgi:hypothetical protein